MLNAIVAKFEQWWEQPFDPNGDAVSWALFVLFILIVSFFWTRVLKHVTE